MPSSFQPPVSGGPHDPYERYRIAEIQSDKGAPDASEGTETFQIKPRSAFAAYVTLLFKRFLDLFENTTELGLAVSAENDVLEHLILFKAALENLKIEDRGQDSPFLNSISVLWHQMLEDVMRFRRQTDLSIKMRAFIKEFQHYPNNQEHSLGYYLTEYAGQKWLPFPYMEMISRLAIQHKKNPQGSLLSRWSATLEEMIQMLKPPEQKKPESN
jgi:hypothetical protein